MAAKQRRLTFFFNKNTDAEESSPVVRNKETETAVSANDGHASLNAKAPKPDSKVKREFRKEWLEQHFWLSYENNKMTCSVCTSEGKDNPFTSGCMNFRSSTLTRHIASNQHKAALESQSLRNNMCRQSQSLILAKNEAAVCAMRSVYWLAKEQLPTSKHKSLLNLQKLQGCSFPDELQVLLVVKILVH